MLIMIGVMIEDDIFALYPQRSRYEKYCSSITSDKPSKSGEQWAEDFSGINMENGREMLARYVYRKKDGSNIPHFDKRNNRKLSMNRWCVGRYRWLNLTLANNDSRGFNTVEFRIFPYTNDYNVCKSYLDIAMSIVWFAENRQSSVINANKGITPRLTLDYILTEFKNHKNKKK
jgi:hypothetical protein